MSDYSAEDFKSVIATSDGYKATVKGQQKNLERSNDDDSLEIALIDQMTVDKAAV